MLAHGTKLGSSVGTMTNTTPKSALKIVRVIRVVDTRDWQEVEDDRWEPIPGSGIENACHRCGRNHEVHAHVMLEDNTTAVIGTGCARGDDLIKGAAFTSAANAAKRIVQLRTKRANAEAQLAEYERARAQVEAMTAPAFVWTEEPAKDGGQRAVVTCGAEGYARSWRVPGLLSPADRAEREGCALRGWQEARMKEALPGYSYSNTPSCLLPMIRDCAEKIAKAEKRLTALYTPAPAAV